MLTKKVNPLKLHTWKNATEHKDIALGAFLDTEGAFDKTSFDTGC
jgi:hypothetical protein